MYRNRHIEKCALDFYKTLPKHIAQFVFNIREAISTLKNCAVFSYQEFAGFSNAGVNDIIAYCESYDACTRKGIDEDKYIILYNDSPDISKGKKAFTLAHELGHILLGHMNILESFGIYHSSHENEHMKKQADYFAACLLCPLPVLYRIKPKSILSVEMIFGLSGKAAEVAFDNYTHYDRTYNIAWHNDILNLFDFEIDLLKDYTYQLDYIYERRIVKPVKVITRGADDFSDDISIDKCRPRNSRINDYGKREKAEVTISPNLYERIVLDWI